MSFLMVLMDGLMWKYVMLCFRQVMASGIRWMIHQWLPLIYDLCWTSKHTCCSTLSKGVLQLLMPKNVFFNWDVDCLCKNSLFWFIFRSTDLKNGDLNQMGFTPGHSSPRPVVTPKLNGHSYTSSSIIGPQLPPHMLKVQHYQSAFYQHENPKFQIQLS